MLPYGVTELRYYQASDGKSPFELWFAELETAAAAKISVALARLEQGNLSNAKGVRGGSRVPHRLGAGIPGLFRVGRGGAGDLADGRHQEAPATRHRQGQGAVDGLQAATAAGTIGKGPQTMALTKSFKELVQSRVARDPEFAAALLREGIDTMLTGDVDTGKAVLRDYIKATVGFEKLGEATHTPPKSLIRMFGPRGNPQARNLFGIIGYLQQQAGVELHVMAGPR